ncbi:hypothetical protein [Rhodococcus sp. B50]|uniref:hypothetical protein n=1 Tax=Rhodococcus sp. B50 TaxID=2682847 RepID=UPI001BD4FFED|nr:hypothetical protein [Rhodococcus sp. B50]MBS9373814.1 hypothetical protein [Rhodococcus sp. B50]
MTNSDVETGSRKGLPPWAKKTIAVVVALIVLVIAYYALAAFVPRWWAQRIAGLADGGFTRGVLWGLLFGILCTAIPISLLAWIWQVRNWRYHRGLQIVFGVLALVVALPNLMTLAVVLGTGNGAHAGERILDVDAPGFRGATLIGAILGALAAMVFVVALTRYRKRGRDLKQARVDLERRRVEQERLDARRDAEKELGRSVDDVPPGSHRL